MEKTGLSTEEVLALLSAFMERQQSVYKLVSLGVFGSFARGEARPDSDIDVVFETDEPNLFRTASLRAELEDLLQRPVDIVRLRDHMNRTLRQQILKEARYV